MLNKMLDFIAESPDAFHAAENVRRRLLEEGYDELKSGDWELAAGGRYFLTRNGSSLIAFRVPEGSIRGFILTASHADSPALKIRTKAELGGSYIRLDVERYGGMINASWVDRPLSIAGRVIVRTEEGLSVRLVDFRKDMALIPNLAPHLNRTINDCAKYDPSKDLIPLYAEGENAGSFLKELAALAGCEPEDIVSSELILYNNQPGTVWGPEKEFVSAPRLDDLACVYGCLEGFLAACSTDRIPVLCVFDNEEVGSGTRQGAGSEFLPRVLSAVSEALFLSPSQHLALIDNSFMLSCDNGHALHPNHPEFADKNEAPVLNGGIVYKHSPKYATDSVSDAVFCEICTRAGVAVQPYANRADLPGGGTLGLIADRTTPVCTVDIGLAQLAMHSSFETMGSRDVEAFFRGVRAVYESRIDFEGEMIRL